MCQTYTYAYLAPEAMTADQFSQIVEIERSCASEPYPPEILMECIRDLDTFVCLSGNTVIGFLTILTGSRYLNGSLYIVNINVRKDCQRQGIAKRMLYEACSYYFSDYKDTLVTLDVRKDNDALHLYRALGFQPLDFPSRNGDTDIPMGTSLIALEGTLHKLLADHSAKEATP